MTSRPAYAARGGGVVWALLRCRLCDDAGMDLFLVAPLLTAAALILGRHTPPPTS